MTPFVGRRDELRRIELALAAAMAGPGQVLAIQGDPGIGKSRLVEATAAMAVRRGVRVVRGRAVDHQRHLPLGLLTAAMVDLVTERAAVLDRRSRQLLAAFFPVLGPAGRQARLTQREPERVHGTLRGLLTGCQDHATALLLDGVHWADAESERFLDRLLRDPLPDRVLVVLAYRPRQVSPRLVAAVAQAVDGGWGAEVTPAGLTWDEASTLAGAEIGGTDLRAALAASRGNPGYLTLLLRRRAANGEYVGDGGLTAEVESLTASALLLLRGAAVVGDPFDAQVAAAVAQVAEPDRPPALDQLLAHDLIRETDFARTYRFRHRLLRDAVYARSGPGWRAGAHARAVARLRLCRRDPVELAPHLVEVAEPGDPAAVSALAEAAAEVVETAPALALRWGAAALALLPDREDTRLLRAELLVTVGSALSRTGHLADGADRLREALHLLPAGSPLRAVAAGRAADADRLRGDPAAARSVLRSEPGRTPGDQTTLRVALAALECGDGNLGAAERHLRAIPADGVVTLAETAVRAWVHAVAGDLPAAHLAAIRYADTMDTLSDDQATSHLEHWVYAVQALHHLGLCERGRRLARRGVSLAHRAGWLTARAALLAAVAASDRSAGRVSSAAAVAAECVDLAGTIDSPVLLRRALAARAEALLWSDRAPAAALRVAEQAVSVGAVGGYFEDARQAGLVLAEVSLAAGRASGLAERVVLAGGGPGLPYWPVPARARVYETLTRLALADADPAGARSWATRAEDVTGTYQLPCPGPALLARAAVLLGDDDTGAHQAAERAAAAFDRAGSPLERGRGCLLVAEALAADRPAVAAAELRTVKEIAVRCGSGRLHRLADAARASVGARRHADDDGDPADPLAALSRREREVAEQLRAGLTNREIAERLYITERTVETHVKHILHKLDLPSRAAVAGLAHQ